MADVPPRATYSIAMVSKLSGVSTHALRAWERRYGFPTPDRSASGHRRYGQEQIDAIRRLVKLSRAGRPIGELIADHQAGGLASSLEIPSAIEDRPAWSTVIDSLFAGDVESAEAWMDRFEADLSYFDAIERLIEPVLVEIGERWFRGEARIFQERFASDLMLGRLERMLDLARRANPTPTFSVLVGSVEGERHRGGVLMVGIALELLGCRAIVVGVDVPPGELGAAASAWDADGVATSFVLSRSIQKRFEGLSSIRDVPVFVGGRGLINYQALARSHGLIPLVGPLRASSIALVGELERRRRSRG